MRKSSNAARLHKGDIFTDPRDGEVLRCEGWPRRADEGIHVVPVMKVDGGQRISRRRFESTQRFKLHVA